jgi:hypothetical protein
MISLLCMLLLSAVQSSPDPGKVVSSVDKTADFASVRTYAWEKGQEVANRDVHKIIVAAIDAEFAGRGLRLAADKASADVLVRYDGLASSYVDLKALDKALQKDPNAVAPTKAMGSLAISMRRPAAEVMMWRGHARDFVDMEPAVREASVRKMVARVFETYPKPSK